MIVYNLACEHNHPFEGWFGSPIDFESQRDRGLVECPVCGSKSVERKLHAPRINLGAAAPAVTSSAATSVAETLNHGEIDFAQLREAMAGLAKHVRDNSENVGERFADEARAMHYGEKPAKSIRGHADNETAKELREEGINVHPLPFPVDLPTAH